MNTILHPRQTETQPTFDKDDSIQVFVAGLAGGSALSVEVSLSTSVCDLLSLLSLYHPQSASRFAKESVVTVGSRSVPNYMLLSDLNIVAGTVIDVSPNIRGGKDKLRVNPKKGTAAIQTQMYRFERFMRKPHQRALVRSLLTRNIGVKICRKCYRRNPSKHDCVFKFPV